MKLKQSWPQYITCNGQKICDITDRPLDERSDEKRGDVRTQRMPASWRDRDVLMPPRKKVEEEVDEVVKAQERHRPQRHR